MNNLHGLHDIIGGNNGTGYGVDLDSNAPVDISTIRSNLTDNFSHKTYDRSYRFNGRSDSYVEIPHIALREDFTYVSFVMPETQGPLWMWDPGYYGNHISSHQTNQFELRFQASGYDYTYTLPVSLGMNKMCLLPLNY